MVQHVSSITLQMLPFPNDFSTLFNTFKFSNKNINWKQSTISLQTINIS